MKLNRRNLLLASSATISLALTVPSAFAATFNGTTTGTFDWASGTDWDLIPVSNLDTTLDYTSTLAESIAIISNNDVASPPFKLNVLNFTNVGPLTGTAPTLKLQGNQLEFVTSTGVVPPTLTFNATGDVLPVIEIANNLLLTDNLEVVAPANATANTTLSGVISGAGALTKTGNGTLILSGANTYNGLTTLTAGNLNLNNASALGGGGNLTFAGGAVAYTAASSGLDLSTRIKNSTSLVTLKLEGQNVNYAGSIDSSNTGGFQVASDGIGVGGNLTVSAANNYSGDTFIGNTNPPGTQDAASITVSGAGTLGNGTINIGRNGNTNGSLLALTGGASLSNPITLGGRAANINIQNLAGNSTLSGAISIQAGGGFCAIQSDAGLLQLTGTSGGGTALTSLATSARTATLQGAGNGLVSGAIINGNATTLSLAKAGAGTWTLSALSATPANNYTGATIINEGTLAITTTNPSLTGGLTFGSSANTTTAGILDLTAATATFTGAMAVNSNSATASEIKIGATQSLTINGNVQIGATTPTVPNTSKLNMTGGGTFNVATAASGIFSVGGSTASGNTAQSAALDLTALKATTINTSANGTLRVGVNHNNNIGGQGQLFLPTPAVADTVATANLTAGNITVGYFGANNNASWQNRLTLGTGLTTLNAGNINVGTGSRDLGQIVYGNATGDLKIRAADGSSRATAINVGSFGGGTAAVGLPVLMDLAGHDANIEVTSLNVGNQSRTGNQTYEFNFGQGDNSLASKLDVINVNIGLRPGGNNTVANILTSRVNISGGTVIFGNGTGTGVDIGNNSLGNATVTGASSTVGELNIGNGTVTINNSASLAAAVRLGSNVALGNGTVEASMNLTGGTTTLSGDIIRNATSPRTTSTVTIIGGTLDMGGNDIGTLASPVALSLQSGVLKNVGEVNGGGLINKTTAGNLTLSGPNTFTGGLDIFNGVLKITETGSLGLGAKNINIQNAPYIALEPSAGSIVLPSTMTFTTAGLAFLNIAGNNTINGAVSIVTGSGTTTVTSDSGSLTLTGAIAPGPAVPTPRNLELAGTSTGANLCSGPITNGANTTLGLVKSGNGSWSLTNAGNAYSGNTTVNAGKLTLAGSANATDANPSNNGSTVTIAANATLNLTYSGTDIVDKFFIGGVQQIAGTYGPTGSFSPTQITGNGTLTVLNSPSGSPYTNWPGGNSTNFYGDANGDGVPNGMTWLLGGANTTSNGLALLPAPVVSGGNMTLTFKTPIETAPAQLSFQYGINLVTWSALVPVPTANGTFANGTFTVTPANATTNNVTLTVSGNASLGGGKLFGRFNSKEN